MKYTSKIFYTFLLFCPLIYSQNEVSKINNLMSYCYKNGMFNGTVLVSKKNKIIYQKTFGIANIEWNISHTTNTKFRIGSITKQFTAMLILQLVQKRLLDLNQPVAKYLPGFAKKITIHHLLTHTSGIPDYTKKPGFWKESLGHAFKQEHLLKYSQRDLIFKPGTKYQYNNTGYFLLAMIIEKVTKKSFKEVLHKKILEPLKMKNTGVDMPMDVLEKRASGYVMGIDGLKNAPYVYMPNHLGAGNIYSTADDLYKWGQALYQDELLSNKFKKTMFAPFLKKYGYGWNIRKWQKSSGKSYKVIFHGGKIGGFHCFITCNLTDKHLIILLDNFNSIRVREINNCIRRMLLNRPYNFPKISFSRLLLVSCQNKNLFSFVDKFYANKKTMLKKYYFNEKEINKVGYKLMWKEHIEEAIKIFKLNVELFPLAWNV